jgi:hypothetical protein
MLEAQKLIASALILLSGVNAQFKGAAAATETFSTADGTYTP